MTTPTPRCPFCNSPAVIPDGPPKSMPERRADGWAWIVAQLRLVADRIEVLAADPARDQEE